MQRRLVDLTRDARHLEHVAVALAAEAVAVQHLVGEGEHVERRLEMADRVVQVDRLDRVAADEVDDVERLAEPQQIAERRPVTRPADAVEIDEVRWATDRSEREVVTADRQRAVGVPRVHLERRRARLDQLDHELGVEADAVGAGLDPCARRREQVA